MRITFAAALLGLFLFVSAVSRLALDPATATSLLALTALAAPILPFDRWITRAMTVRIAVLAIALGGATAGAPAAAHAGAFVTLAGGALLLHAGVAHIDRRATILAAAAALVLYHASALAGLQSVQTATQQLAAVALVLLLLFAPARAWRPDEAAHRSFERRAGGMRLRGALLLGMVLYIHTVLLAPPTRAFAAAAAGGAVAAAMLLGLAPMLPAVSRRYGVPTACLAAAAIAFTPVAARADDVAVAAAVFAAAAAATALVSPALQPAGGRRSGASVALGLAAVPLLAAWRPHGVALLAVLALLPLIVAVLPRTISQRGLLRRGVALRAAKADGRDAS